MATKNALHTISVEAGQDLSANQYYFVAMASDGQVDPAGDGALALGVLQDDPAAAGRAASVAIGGQTKVVAGGAITAGDQVASDANGKAVTAATGDNVLGIATQTANADGDIISIVLAEHG